MRYELYKLFRRRMIPIFLIFGLLWVAASGIVPAFQYETYTEDMELLHGLSAIKYDRELQNTYAGRLAMDELESLWRECQDIYSDPNYQRESGIAAGKGNTTPLTDEAYWKYLRRFGVISAVGTKTYISPLYIDDARKNGDLTELYLGSIVVLPSEDVLIPAADPNSPIVQRVIGMYDNLEYPLYGEYYAGWIDFFNTVPFFFRWIVGPMIVVGLAPVFADETSTGCDKLLLTTKYGKSRLIRNKILAALLYATIIFCAFALTAVLSYVGCYGLSGLRASIQLLPHGSLSPYNLSIGGAIGLWGVLGWISALAIAAIATFFSAVTPNAFAAVIPALTMYIVPSFSCAGLSPALHRITRLMPINVIGSIDHIFSVADFYCFFGMLADSKIWIAAVLIAIIFVFPLLSAVLFLQKEPSK